MVIMVCGVIFNIPRFKELAHSILDEWKTMLGDRLPTGTSEHALDNEGEKFSLGKESSKKPISESILITKPTSCLRSQGGANHALVMESPEHSRGAA